MEPRDGFEERNSSRKGIYLAIAAAVVAVAASALWPADTEVGPPQLPQQGDTLAREPSPFGQGPAVLGPDRSAADAGSLASGTGSRQAERPLRGDDYRALMEKFDAGVRKNIGDPQLKRLAASLDQGLDEQLDAMVVEPGEALMLKADILDVLEPNRNARGPALLAWMRAQPIFQVPVGEPGEAHVEEYKRGEEAIVMAWQALPPLQRDPEELESQLDRLLLKSFNLPSS